MSSSEDQKSKENTFGKEYNRIVLETTSHWDVDLAKAVDRATDKDLLIVSSEAKRVAAIAYAEKRGKKINIETERPTGSI